MLKISSTFDSGAIEVVRLDDPADIRLRLRKDNAADFHQWFHFRLMGAAGKPVRMVFENAATAAYLENGREPRRDAGELDNRGSTFYLTLYWAQALAAAAQGRQLLHLADFPGNHAATQCRHGLDVAGLPAGAGTADWCLPAGNREKVASVTRAAAGWKPCPETESNCAANSDSMNRRRRSCRGKLLILAMEIRREPLEHKHQWCRLWATVPTDW